MLIHISARAILMLALLAAAPLRAETPPAKTPAVKTFKDWIVGCDNLRHCTAIGTSPGMEFSGYVVVRRGAEGAAAPQVSFLARSDNPIKAPVALSILLDETPVPGMSGTSVPAQPDGSDTSVVRAQLEGHDAATLLGRMREGQKLDIKVAGADQSSFGSTISLAGAAAAFLHMDAAQLRTGTVTALVNPGTAPAGTIPPVPPVPVLHAVVMHEVKDPPADLPKGVPPADPDDCSGPPPKPSVIRLSPGLELWGICYVRTRYRDLETYWIVGKDGAKPASFLIPGRAPSDDGAGVLVNSELSKDGRVLEAFDQGRGLGDCGTYAKWAWTGTAFELAYLAEMSDCRGVRKEDWPVTFTSLWR